MPWIGADLKSLGSTFPYAASRHAYSHLPNKHNSTCHKEPRCSAATFSWVNRADEVSTSGRSEPELQRPGRYQRLRRGPLKAPPKESGITDEGETQQQHNGSAAPAQRRGADVPRTSRVATPSKVSQKRRDGYTSSAEQRLLHTINSFRSARNQSAKAELLKGGVAAQLTADIIKHLPSAQPRELAAYLSDLAEIDSIQTEVSCRPALLATAAAFSAVLESGAKCQPGNLCKALNAIALCPTIKKECAPLVGSIVRAVEPQLEACRPRDLVILATELCALGVFRQHAALVRRAVELALGAAGSLTARQLAGLCGACGQLGNVPRAQMLELAEHVERCASQLRPGSILLVLQAFGRYDLPVSGLVATLADAAEGQLSMLKPASFSRLVWSFGKLGLKPRGSFSSCVLRETDGRLERLDTRSYASLFWGLSKMSITPSPQLLDCACEAMELDVQQRREQGHWQAQKHAHDISQIIWALGCFGHAPSRMPFLLAEAEAALEVSNDMDLTNIIGGLASLEQPLPGSESLMLKAEQRACHLITVFSPRGLSNLLWAFAKLEQPVPDLLEMAAAEVTRRVDDFNVRDMSDVLWAFARLGHLNTPALAEAMSSRTANVMNSGGEWAVWDVARMTWALGVLEVGHMGFLEACRQLVAPRLHSASGRDLANLLWGFARLQISLPAMDVYTARLGELANTLSPGDVSSVLWAYSQLRAYPGIEIMETLVTRTRLTLSTHSPQCIAGVVNACAALLHHPGELLDGVAADMAARPSEYDLFAWTSILWAFTRLGQPPGHLYALLADEVDEGRVVMDPRLISTLLWSLAMFQAFESPLYDGCIRELKAFPIHSFDSPSLRRLYQAQMMATALRRPSSAQLPLKFQAPARAAWAETVHEPREAYDMVMDVADCLTGLGLPARHGHLEADGMFKVDILLDPEDCAGRKVAIEILSPRKMTRNTHQPLSRVLYRKACLRAWGYAVLSVPWHDWVLLGDAEDSLCAQKAKEDYLRELLAPVLPSSFGEERDVESDSSALEEVFFSAVGTGGDS